MEHYLVICHWVFSPIIQVSLPCDTEAAEQESEQEKRKEEEEENLEEGEAA